MQSQFYIEYFISQFKLEIDLIETKYTFIVTFISKVHFGDKIILEYVIDVFDFMVTLNHVVLYLLIYE